MKSLLSIYKPALLLLTLSAILMLGCAPSGPAPKDEEKTDLNMPPTPETNGAPSGVTETPPSEE